VILASKQAWDGDTEKTFSLFYDGPSLNQIATVAGSRNANLDLREVQKQKEVSVSLSQPA
jgi:hypothetical protein